jgi:type VI protein secretion system component Hcp
MNKTNDTSKLGNAKLEDRVLADSELAAVTGGKLIDKPTPKLYEACCKGTHIPEVTIS